MDAKDVSGEQWIVSLLQQGQQREERARQKKGQLVQTFPPAEQVISGFMRSLLVLSTSKFSMRNTIATSQLPPPYAPCHRPLKELEPIAISDMKLEIHHRGKETLVRVLTPPQRMTGVMAIVEDEQGTAILLQLYNQPDGSLVPANEVMKPHDVFILKEPFFKSTADGSYSLRVDHLGDVVRLDNTDERIPSKWRRPVLMPGHPSKSMRMQGNEAVRTEDWAEAQRLYSSAIQTAETAEEECLAYLNRSLANMKLGRPEQALWDAKQSSDITSPSEKGLFREARALYELGDFAHCLETLETLLMSYPENAAGKKEKDRAKARLHEQQTGTYDFRRMYEQARQTPPLIDCATFSVPVEIRSSPGRGKGLFTKVPVSAGQLLVCEKAFGYSYADEGQNISVLINMSTKKGAMGGQARLLTQLIQKMYHDPHALSLFNELHHGDYDPPPISEVDGHPVVDSFLVDQIRALNSFGSPRTCRDTYLAGQAEGSDTKGDKKANYTCGIWLLASRIKHSCIGNCQRSFIGDMQIIRAAKDLDADTELSFGYRAPQALESYEDVQKALGNWGFTCTCELCASRKKTSKSTLQSRKKLFMDLDKYLGGIGKTNIPGAKRLLKQVEKTYPAMGPNAIRLKLWEPYFALGIDMLSAGKPADTLSMFIKGLEALGFSINATVPTDSAKTPVFQIMRWGLTIDCTPWAFLQIFLVYERLAPELCAVAKRYTGIAYSILLGEEETLCDEFPELA